MIPLYTSQQVREADNFAINTLGIPSIVLMENAARSLYQDILLNLSEKLENKNVGIVCGKGNNGGDGFAVARHFIINEYFVKIISLGAEEELKGDALTNFRIIKNLINEYPSSKLMIYESAKDLSQFDDCSLIIDAMLGTGSRGELTEPYKEIVERINQSNAFKVAVDLPTGLDLENAYGEVVFNADLTVTLSNYKTGLFYGKGYVNCGSISRGTIGIGNEFYSKLIISDYLIEPEDAYYGLPAKKLDQHKYSAGKVFVIAGSGKLPGASFLTANAVLRSGAGSSVLAFPKSIKTLAQQMLDSAIVYAYEDSGQEILSDKNLKELDDKINWANVVAIGPGLGRDQSTIDAVIEILKKHKSKKFVIDADGIFALRNEEYKKLNLKGNVLTPHQKEFSDMIGISLDELEKNILKYGKIFSTENGCYLVLKGAPTIIFNPGGETFINSAGNPGLAKFGSGDVLTGMIAGFLAQSNEIEDALISAIYIHSLAADLLLEEKTEYGYTSEDLIDQIPHAIKFILNSFV
ncbi:MAG: NAD(P)H-hydrate dehydratase [Ignavibacteriales bacterium]|nr:NAD(P)H-hydrate dehydratase [Ignavibacteriales bacterium]